MAQKSIVYIGDFDLRNENVQAHLVMNNGKIFNKLGYSVFYVGINRNCESFEEIDKLKSVKIENCGYLELPYTLTTKGLLLFTKVKKRVISYLNNIRSQEIGYIVSYQAPTYARILKEITLWCKENNVPYIVNCADLPVFDSQPLIKRLVMEYNWKKMHKINNNYADGVIAVSGYIKNFYKNENRPSVIIPPLFDEPELANVKTEGNDTPVFLYAGTPFISSTHEVNTKGMKDRLDIIIDLMLEIERKGYVFRFDIIGITKKEYSTCVPRHADELKKSNDIVFYGRQSHEYTLRKLVDADYMINYRDKNLMTEAGLSTKVVESVSIGTPVIMNDVGDTFLYLESGVSGIKLTGNFYQDVDIVSKLCKISKIDRMKNKNVIRSSNVFSIEKYKPVMKKFLENVNESFIERKND